MGIELKEITQKYGDLIAVNNANLFIEDGEMIALLGPSGCGKTTLLKTIAGLLPLHQGSILSNEKDISNLPPQARNAAMVFQNYALFPHMTVAENVAYGLKINKCAPLLIKKKVEEILDIVELPGLNQRKISELSGGQQQRVALARALVIEPAMLLFDEPLSNLDQNLRVSMRRMIRKIQQEYRITSIYVTHDQEEAMSISDRIVVMKDGVIQQIGLPGEVYLNPRNRFVAEFMGTANLLELNEDDEIIQLLECGKWASSRDNCPGGESNNRQKRYLMFRPEDVEVGAEGNFEGTVIWHETIGSVTRVSIDFAGNEIIAEIRNYYKSGINCTIGEKIRFNIDLAGDGHIVPD